MNCKSRYGLAYINYSILLNDLFNKFYTFAFNNIGNLPEDRNRSSGGLKSEFIGKLAIVDAPEGKKRVIATVDYFTQFLLRPIGKEMFKVLKQLKTDRTFTQSPFHD
jgi:hypothetical protein